MKATGNTIINNYLMLLKSLSPNEKLELIARLSQSLKSKQKVEVDDTAWKSLFGALQLETSVDDFINNLKQERSFRDKSIEL